MGAKEIKYLPYFASLGGKGGYYIIDIQSHASFEKYFY
jgi:hypothetical protein